MFGSFAGLRSICMEVRVQWKRVIGTVERYPDGAAVRTAMTIVLAELNSGKARISGSSNAVVCQSRFEVTVRICSRPHAPSGNARAAMDPAPVFVATSRRSCPRYGYKDNSRIPRPRSTVHRVKWPFGHSE